MKIIGKNKVTFGNVTFEDVQNARQNATHSVNGIFATFCDLNSSCDDCNRRVRLWCKIRNRIRKRQETIIKKL